MKLLLLLSLFFATGVVHSQNWSQITDYSGSARDDGTTFKIGNTVFCGTGRNAGFNVTSDFKAFDLSTETWSSISSMPDICARQYAEGFAYNGEGYIFGGINGAGEYLNDLWKYSPGTDQWTFVSEMPAEGRGGMSHFILDDKVYIVGGKSLFNPSELECWEFDLVNFVWTYKNSLPGGGMWRGVSFTYDTTAFIGLGLDNLGNENEQFYHYLPSTDQWQLVPQLITNPRSYVAHAQIGDSVYLYGGVDTSGIYVNSFERINIPSLTIDNLTSFPSDARKGCMAFTSKRDFFISTGITTTARLDETWVARKVVGLDGAFINQFTVYQKGDDLRIFGVHEYDRIEIRDKMGRLVLEAPKSVNGTYKINGLGDGIYFYRVYGEKAVGIGRIAIFGSF